MGKNVKEPYVMGQNVKAWDENELRGKLPAREVNDLIGQRGSVGRWVGVGGERETSSE